jgi:hypothetical protein
MRWAKKQSFVSGVPGPTLCPSQNCAWPNFYYGWNQWRNTLIVGTGLDLNSRKTTERRRQDAGRFSLLFALEFTTVQEDVR